MAFSLDIYRDRYDQINLDPIVEGVGLLEPITGAFDIELPRRPFQPLPGYYGDDVKGESIDMTRIQPRITRSLKADFTLVVTQRNLMTNWGDVLAGPPRHMDRRLQRVAGAALTAFGVAFVQELHKQPDNTRNTAAHELGHLFDILNSQESGGRHCENDACLMHFQNTPEVVASEANPVDRFLKKIGLPIVDVRPKATDFCESCKEDLAQQVLVMPSMLATRRKY